MATSCCYPRISRFCLDHHTPSCPAPRPHWVTTIWTRLIARPFMSLEFWQYCGSILSGLQMIGVSSTRTYSSTSEAQGLMHIHSTSTREMVVLVFLSLVFRTSLPCTFVIEFTQGRHHRDRVQQSSCTQTGRHAPAQRPFTYCSMVTVRNRKPHIAVRRSSSRRPE